MKHFYLKQYIAFHISQIYLISQFQLFYQTPKQVDFLNNNSFYPFTSLFKA